ncbi:MAG TPA: 16S rRNA (guanine(966)-N(2))-methyltransferase RsmD [Bacillota bacterium]|nr:16S rRNA (guanine(966)-N(2))-methyltransferase RsmD [Bacillota bacterium]
MRVITGSAKGRRLSAPKGMSTRPTTDRVKEALFNILGDRVNEARVLDLFAGTGALAIEALSRGASGAVLVEREGQAVSAIRQNLLATGLAERAIIARQEVLDFLGRQTDYSGPFNLIFMDPPYQQGLELKALELIEQAHWLAEEGLIVVESSKHSELQERVGTMVLMRREKYGDTCLNFYSRSAGE